MKSGRSRREAVGDRRAATHIGSHGSGTRFQREELPSNQPIWGRVDTNPNLINLRGLVTDRPRKGKITRTKDEFETGVINLNRDIPAAADEL